MAPLSILDAFLAPCFTFAYGVVLEGMIHWDSAREKGLADAHFSVAIILSFRLVRGTDSDV